MGVRRLAWLGRAKGVALAAWDGACTVTAVFAAISGAGLPVLRCAPKCLPDIDATVCQVLLGEFEDDEVRSALRTQLTALQPQVGIAGMRCSIAKACCNVGFCLV